MLSLCDFLRSEIANKGFILLRSYFPEQPTQQVATDLGELLFVRTLAGVQTLTPKDVSEAPSNTYSGMYGLKGFPLHSDLAHDRNPPPYLMLRCVIGRPDVQTLLQDTRPLVNAVGPDLLSRSLVRPRRPYNGEMPLLRLLKPVEDERFVFRWDQRFIEPANSVGKLGVQKTAEVLSSFSPWPISLSDPGDTLVVDNWRVLHGRSKIPSASLGRMIERAYLERLH